MKRAVSLEDYLKPNEEVKNFLEWEEFWNENLKTSAQIPLEWLMENDPTCVVVGKDKEIETARIVNYKAAVIELEREQLFNDLRFLLLEIDYLKKHGMTTEVNKRELKLRETNDKYDWVDCYKKVVNDLEKEGKYNRQKALKRIFKKYPTVLVESDVDYNIVSERMKREFKDPVILTFIGPKGSGKSFIQKILMEDYELLCKKLGVRCFEILGSRDYDSPIIIKLLGGEGQEILKIYDNKIERKRKIKKFITTAILVILAYPTFTFIKGVSGSSLSGTWAWGLGALAALGQKIWGMWWQVVSIISLVFGIKFVRRYLKDKSRVDGDRPVWVSNTDNLFPIYGGPISMKDMVGEYRPNNEKPPQEWIIGGSLLSADGRGTIIEQLSETPVSEQSILAQVIQEGEIPVGEGEFRTDFNSLYYIGQNPDLIHEVKRALVDRLNTNEGDFVTNEMVRDTRAERKFLIFLEYWRKFREGKPFHIHAYQELLKLSSMFAEDNNTLTINRRFLAIIDGAIDIARLSDKDFVSQMDVRKSFQERRSRIEQGLEDRLEKHRANHPLNINDSVVGRVNVLSFLTDTSVFKDVRDPFLRSEMAYEEGLGYVVPVVAEARHSDETFIKILAPDKWSEETVCSYTNALYTLFERTNIAKSKYHILIDTSEALAEDKTLITAMYVAIYSAIYGIHMRQNKLLLGETDLSGVLGHSKRTNRRIFRSFDPVNHVVLPSVNFEDKINPKNYLVNFSTAENLEEIINHMRE